MRAFDNLARDDPARNYQALKDMFLRSLLLRFASAGHTYPSHAPGP